MRDTERYLFFFSHINGWKIQERRDDMERFGLPLLIVCVFILLPLSVKDAIKSYRMWKLHQKMGECNGKIVKILKGNPVPVRKSWTARCCHEVQIQNPVSGKRKYRLRRLLFGWEEASNRGYRPSTVCPGTSYPASATESKRALRLFFFCPKTRKLPYLLRWKK